MVLIKTNDNGSSGVNGHEDDVADGMMARKKVMATKRPSKMCSLLISR